MNMVIHQYDKKDKNVYLNIPQKTIISSETNMGNTFRQGGLR